MISKNFLKAFLFAVTIGISWKSAAQEGIRFTSTPVSQAKTGIHYSYGAQAESKESKALISPVSLPDWLTFGTVNGTTASTLLEDNDHIGGVYGIDSDASGNVYLADWTNNVILVYNTDGVLDTLAGTGVAGSDDGPMATATFDGPTDVTVDAVGNIYVIEYNSHLVRKISTDGQVTTIAGSGSAGSADGQGIEASFNQPGGITIDGSGNLYIADYGNHLIRKVDTEGNVTTLAGQTSPGFTNGTGTAAQFNFPSGVATDGDGNIYVADFNNHAIRKITPAGEVTTVAGNGTAGFTNGSLAEATFNGLSDVELDLEGNIYVADISNYSIRKISTDGQVSTVAGTGIRKENDENAFSDIWGIDITDNGNIYIPEIDFSSGGDFKVIESAQGVYGMPAVEGSYQVILQASTDFISSEQRFTIEVQDGVAPEITSATAISVAEGNAGTVYVVTATDASPTGGALTYTITGGTDAGIFTLSGNSLSFIRTPDHEFPADKNSDNVYEVEITVSDEHNNTSALSLQITVTNETESAFTFSTTTIDTLKEGQQLSFTPQASLEGESPDLYSLISAPDWVSGKYDPISVELFSGNGAAGYQDGSPLNAKFADVDGMTFDSAGNLYIADHNNHAIRIIAPDGTASTFAGGNGAGYLDGDASSAKFNGPSDVAFDAEGNLYVADMDNHMVRKITPEGVVSTVAGSGVGGYLDGNALEARFYFLSGLVVDADGNIIIADRSNYRIRKLDLSTNTVSTVAGSGIYNDNDGSGTLASFIWATKVAVGPDGFIYVVDASANKIKKINPDTYEVTSILGGDEGFADGSGTDAMLNDPYDLEFDNQGNLYIIDLSNNALRMMDTTGYLTTVAGGTHGDVIGTPGEAAFRYPSTFAWSKEAIVIYDDQNNKFKKLANEYRVTGDTEGNPGTYQFTLQAQSGTTTTNQTYNLVVTDADAPVFTSGTEHSLLENNETYVFTVNATDDGPFGEDITYSISSDNDGDLFSLEDGSQIFFKQVPDYENPLDVGINNIYEITIVATDQFGNSAEQMVTITVENSTENGIHIVSTPKLTVKEGEYYSYKIAVTAEERENFQATASGLPEWLSINKVLGDKVTTYTKGGSSISDPIDGPKGTGTLGRLEGLTVGPDNNIYFTNRNGNTLRMVRSDGSVVTLSKESGVGEYNEGKVDTARLGMVEDLAFHENGDLFVASYIGYISKVDLTDSTLTRYAGTGVQTSLDGFRTEATFKVPSSVAWDNDGNMYVADSGADNIRKIDTEGDVTTFASGLEDYRSIVFDPVRELLYVIDNFSVIYSYDLEGNSKLVAGKKITGNGYKDGTGAEVIFDLITNITLDADGNLYAADYGGQTIRKITPEGVVTTILGSKWNAGYLDGFGTGVQFDRPRDLEFDNFGNLIIGELTNAAIRKVAFTYEISGIAPVGAIGEYPITIDVSRDDDSASQSYTLVVTDNTAPVMADTAVTVLGGESVLAARLMATDNHTALENFTYEILPGGDGDYFTTDGYSLNFIEVPSVNNPQDATRDNIYTFDVKVYDEAGLSDTAGVTVTVTDDPDLVSKLPLTITAEAATITYGSIETPDLSATIYGFVFSDDESVLDGMLDFDVATVTDAGTYTDGITPKGLSSELYDITYVSADLTVTPKNIELVVTPLEGTVTTHKGNKHFANSDFSVIYQFSAPVVGFTADNVAIGAPSRDFISSVDMIANDSLFQVNLTPIDYGVYKFEVRNFDNYEITYEITSVNFVKAKILKDKVWVGEDAPTIEDDVVVLGSSDGINFEAKSLSLPVAGDTLKITPDSHGNMVIDSAIVNEGVIEIPSGTSLVNYGEIKGDGIFRFERNTTHSATDGKYSFIGSPITEGRMSSLGKVVYEYDETVDFEAGVLDGLNNYVVPTSDVMTPGKGYASAYTGTIVFEGKPNTGSIFIPVTKTDYPTISVASEGFNMLSNPYPCALDFEKFIQANTYDADLNPDGILQGTIWIWDDPDSEVERGSSSDFLTINSIGMVGGSNKNGKDWVSNLGTSQGFFVKVSDDPAVEYGTHYVYFEDSMKVEGWNSDSSFFRNTNLEILDKLMISISDELNSKDETLIGFRDDASTGVESRYDASKIDAKSGLRIFSVVEEKPFAIQGLPNDVRNTTVELGIHIEQSGHHYLAWDFFDFAKSSSMVVLLKDLYLNREINMQTTNSYDFNAETDQDHERFRIEITDLTISENQFNVITDLSHHEEVLISLENKSLQVNSRMELKDFDIDLIDLSGRRFWHLEEQRTENGKWQQSTHNLPGGIYIMKLKTEDGKFITRKILLE